jgi:quercetin dioxygenase-like cupin family protein
MAVAQQRLVVGPQEGDRLDLGPGLGIVFKLEAAQTGGAFSVVEHPVEPRALVWPHVHEQNDEFSYVLEGEIRVTGFQCRELRLRRTKGVISTVKTQ